MDAITYTAARNNLASVMNRVCEDSETLIVTSPKNKVVMMSLADYESLQETCYLLSNPANAARLRRSMEQSRKGEFSNVTLKNV